MNHMVAESVSRKMPGRRCQGPPDTQLTRAGGKPRIAIAGGATTSKKGDRLRDRAEELRANADNTRVEECHRVSLELAELAEELADQWDALAVTMTGFLE
jgi:hypothetical protein